MEQNYDFNRIGKQMPYTVPDGFFDQLEENVMKKWKEEGGKRKEDTSSSRKARIVRMAFRTLLAAAACLDLFLIVRKALPQGSDAVTDDFASVELAFNNLSTEDQDYLLEVYQEEQFLDNYLNDLNNEESI
ncbi:MAG: hypothetical protein J6W38_10380 [Prevotella sp.]|nr:hypothetical protein [Prevotella sp.]